ncbi:universal stress protein A-like protein [Elaeis guineensis]|uniref:universal stress protein A-like protein n=1 Tax=Elaeis guineensis var. tenera TaxID=51953 RepID=UPI003C6CF669
MVKKTPSVFLEDVPRLSPDREMMSSISLIAAKIINRGFDDMDSVYASPEDFRSMKQRDSIRGLHLLEYFVGCCHQLGTTGHGNGTVYALPRNEVDSDVSYIFLVLKVMFALVHLFPFVVMQLPSMEVFVGTVSELCAKHADSPFITIKRKTNEAPQDPVDD